MKIEIEVDGPNNIPLGLYRVYWKSGGCSLAAVGATPEGSRWLAPVNWVAPMTKHCPWDDVEGLEAIEVKRADDKPQRTDTEKMLVEALETIKRTSTNGIVIQISLEALADAKKMRGE